MRQFIKNIRRSSSRYLPLLIFIFFLILTLKQLDLYERLSSIYAACLPIIMGGLIAFLLQPLIDRVHLHVSTKAAVIIVYTGIIVFVVGLVAIMIPLLYQQVVDVVDVLPVWISKLEDFMSTYHIEYDNLSRLKQTYMQEGYVFVIDSLKTTMQTATKYGIAFFTAFFISIDLDFWKRTARKVLPDAQRVKTFYLTMSNIVYQYLMGTLLDILFIIISVGFVLILSGFPNGLLYAIILALLNLFPYVGATIGLILIAVVGLLSYDNFPFLTFAVIWVIQQIEANIIQPLIFKRTMNVRPILAFIFIFISEAFFGLPGVILSPILAAIAQIAFRSWLHARTSNRVGDWEDIWQDFDEAMQEESQILEKEDTCTWK